MSNRFIMPEAVEERQIIDAVEESAKRAISVVVARKAELKEKKEELESILLRDNGYADAVERSKTMAKIKKEARETAIKAEGAEELVEDIKELSTEKKDKQLALFDYLLEFNRKTGKTEIVDTTGQNHYIVIGASIKI